MAIDVDADVASILGSNADFTRTSGTYAPAGGGASDSITGILFERQLERMAADRGVNYCQAIFVVDADEFSNVTVRSAGDTLTISGQIQWVVERVRERVQHVTLDLRKTASPGRSA